MCTARAASSGTAVSASGVDTSTVMTTIRRFRTETLTTAQDADGGRARATAHASIADRRSRQSPPKSRKTYRREHSDAWEAKDAEADEFYVYVLKLDDGSFYAGQTRELRERLMEHRDGTTRSTVGRSPKLVWFSTVSTRVQATVLEVQLKKLCDRNPREIRRWVRRFRDLVEELDFS